MESNRRLRARAGNAFQQPRGIGHRLPVIASRGGNYPARAFVRWELRNKVDAAAHFERAHWLVVFVLDVNFCAEQRIHRRIAVQRRARQVRTYAALCLQDILEGWCIDSRHGRASFRLLVSCRFTSP